MTRWPGSVLLATLGLCFAPAVHGAPPIARPAKALPSTRPAKAPPATQPSTAPATTQPAKAGTEAAERANFVGVWKGFAVEGKGENPDRGPVKLELTVTERTMHGIQIQGNQRIDHGEGDFLLDLAAKPPRLDGVQTNERGRKKEYIGIYRLEGDTLKWCVSPQKTRPETFETKKGQFLLILKKDRKAERPAR